MFSDMDFASEFPLHEVFSGLSITVVLTIEAG
jgi:hypothetical protein